MKAMYSRIDRGGTHLLPGVVPAPVINQDDLKRVRIWLECLQDPFDQWPDVLRLVIQRRNYRENRS
jgi:hypothetical protein